jgi:hypothetical protein
MTDPATTRALGAWSRALAVLDQSEILAMDCIQRELACVGPHLPLTRVIKISNRLAAKIAVLRKAAIKSAFRTLRTRLGTAGVLDKSWSAWAATIARADMQAILMTLQTALTDGCDAQECAARVCGTMSKNGADSATEITRFKLAWLARTHIKEGRKTK